LWIVVALLASAGVTMRHALLMQWHIFGIWLPYFDLFHSLHWIASDRVVWNCSSTLLFPQVCVFDELLCWWILFTKLCNFLKIFGRDGLFFMVILVNVMNPFFGGECVLVLSFSHCSLHHWFFFSPSLQFLFCYVSYVFLFRQSCIWFLHTWTHLFSLILFNFQCFLFLQCIRFLHE